MEIKEVFEIYSLFKNKVEARDRERLNQSDFAGLATSRGWVAELLAERRMKILDIPGSTKP